MIAALLGALAKAGTTAGKAAGSYAKKSMLDPYTGSGAPTGDSDGDVAKTIGRTPAFGPGGEQSHPDAGTNIPAFSYNPSPGLMPSPGGDLFRPPAPEPITPMLAPRRPMPAQAQPGAGRKILGVMSNVLGY